MLGLRIRVGTHQAKHHVGPVGIAGPYFLAADDVVITIAPGGGAHGVRRYRRLCVLYVAIDVCVEDAANPTGALVCGASNATGAREASGEWLARFRDALTERHVCGVNNRQAGRQGDSALFRLQPLSPQPLLNSMPHWG